MRNLFHIDDDNRAVEVSEVLVEGEELKLERILSFGHPSAAGEWYDQKEDEWVALIQGEAVLEYGGGDMVELAGGDNLIIEAGVKHRVRSVSDDAIWIALFYKKK